VEHDLVRPGRRPGADSVRDRAGVAGDGGGALPPHRREPWRRVRAGHRQQVENDRVRAAATSGGPGLDDLPRSAHPVDGAARVQDGAVGELAAYPQGARAGRRAVDRRRGQRRPVERHIVQLHVAAVHRHPLAVKQPA
jgi:hypothetical protein